MARKTQHHCARIGGRGSRHSTYATDSRDTTYGCRMMIQSVRSSTITLAARAAVGRCRPRMRPLPRHPFRLRFSSRLGIRRGLLGEQLVECHRLFSGSCHRLGFGSGVDGLPSLDSRCSSTSRTQLLDDLIGRCDLRSRQQQPAAKRATAELRGVCGSALGRLQRRVKVVLRWPMAGHLVNPTRVGLSLDLSQSRRHSLSQGHSTRLQCLFEFNTLSWRPKGASST